jgi:hypothetical protein
MVWDKDAGAEVLTKVKHAKVDLPLGLWSKKILDILTSVAEASGKPADDLSSFELSFEYNESKPPAEMYGKIKVKPASVKIDPAAVMAEQRQAFEASRAFVPSAMPF